MNVIIVIYFFQPCDLVQMYKSFLFMFIYESVLQSTTMQATD